MADESKKTAANIQFKKLQRAEDGKRAMLEYETAASANRVKTARLRALRMARDAEAGDQSRARAGEEKGGEEKVAPRLLRALCRRRP